MKKLILSGIFVTAIALVALNFYSNSRENEMSDIVKANIEALSEKLPLEYAGDPDIVDGSGSNLETAYIDLSTITSPPPEKIYAEFKFKLKNQDDPRDNGKCSSKRMRIESIDGWCYCSN
jgi:hypothetical protein